MSRASLRHERCGFSQQKGKKILLSKCINAYLVRQNVPQRSVSVTATLRRFSNKLEEEQLINGDRQQERWKTTSPAGNGWWLWRCVCSVRLVTVCVCAGQYRWEKIRFHSCLRLGWGVGGRWEFSMQKASLSWEQIGDKVVPSEDCVVNHCPSDFKLDFLNYSIIPSIKTNKIKTV